jgi:cell division protein FtsZ
MDLPEPAPIPRAKPLSPAPELMPTKASARAETSVVDDQPFVADPAVDPDEAPMAYDEPAPEAMPAPVMEEAKPEPRRGRGLSLFAKMTGAVRGTEARADARAESERPALPRKPAGSTGPLGGLAADPEDRLPRRRQEEDLLEIPSFLRRQAN